MVGKAYDNAVTTFCKRMLSVCATVMLLAGMSRAENVKDLPQPTSYVSDLAGVIDADSRAQMEALGAEVERETHSTIEIVTVHSLGGEAIEDFATQLEDKWRVGPKGTDRGVLMILAIDDHKRRIEVGNGLEGVLNDIGRTMVPALQAGSYGQALLGGEQQIANDIAADAGVTLTPLAPRPQARQAVPQHSGGFGIFPIIVLLIFLFFLFRGGRGGRGGGGGGGLGWFLLGNLLGGAGRGGGGGFGGGGGGFGGGGGGGNDDGGFSGGFGGGSEGGGASGSW